MRVNHAWPQAFEAKQSEVARTEATIKECQEALKRATAAIDGVKAECAALTKKVEEAKAISAAANERLTKFEASSN